MLKEAYVEARIYSKKENQITFIQLTASRQELMLFEKTMK